MNEWKYMVDDELTFYGVYCEHYDDVAKKWSAVSTRTQNELTYLNKIIPNIKDHDTKPIGSYLREDYDAVIDSITKKGQGKDSEPYQPYAESTVKNFRRLIYYVVEAAAQNGLCDNILWESCYNPKVSTDSKEEMAKNALLCKSLTVDQEIAVASTLLSDPMQVGQNMGLLLMYALGLRNAEACAVDFEDIKPMQNHPECTVIWIYKTTGYSHNFRKLGGKSRNADRIIPVPNIVASLISTRRAQLEDQLGKPVNKLPIACIENRWEERCSAKQLTTAARHLFQSINMKAAQLSSIDEELRSDVTSPLPVEELDPTAYILRRNFGMHMAINGLTEYEIQYVLGHDVESPYETRNEFVNDDKLFQICTKMSQRPLVNTISTSSTPTTMQPFSQNDITARSTIVVPADGKKIKLRLHSKEHPDVMTIRVVSHPLNRRIGVEADMYSSAQNAQVKSIDVSKQYHKLYCKKSN